MKRDFLKLLDRTEEEYRALFRRAAALKERRRRRELDRTLEGRTLVLLFEKHSTRTRLSFEAAIGQLGGSAITLSTTDSQLSRGETLTDTGRVISRYADAIMFRTHADARLEELARAATIPVVNGLSDGGHPVQILADLFTVEERLGSLEGKVLTFVGDCASNMGRSFIEATRRFPFALRLSAPEGYRPSEEALAGAGRVELVADPAAAVSGADVVITDVWTSMGQEAESARRKQALAPWQLDQALLAKAKRSAIVLHCLPAHRGEEITAEVLDGPQSAAWDEAENRLHVQKALLEQLILAGGPS